MKRIALLASFILSGASLNALAVTPAADAEVQKLLRFVGKSGCTFIRGGSTYTAAQAQEHLTMKYGKAREKIDTSDDFINEIASKSYLSGQPYLIHCPPAAQQPTGVWLHAELKRLRNTK